MFNSSKELNNISESFCSKDFSITPNQKQNMREC